MEFYNKYKKPPEHGEKVLAIWDANGENEILESYFYTTPVYLEEDFKEPGEFTSYIAKEFGYNVQPVYWAKYPALPKQ